MKSRIVLAIAAVLTTVVLATTANPPQAVTRGQVNDGTGRTVVTISGNLSNPTFGTFLVVGVASGPTDDTLTGSGFDGPPVGSGASGAPGNPAVCQFTLAGALSNDGVVNLSGTVVATSFPGFLGIPVTFTADASTGSILWTFAGIPFTGTGSVMVRTE